MQVPSDPGQVSAEDVESGFTDAGLMEGPVAEAPLIENTQGEGTVDFPVAGEDSKAPDCGILRAVVRDFSTSHPDFETFGGIEGLRGILEEELGPDAKPVYAHEGPTSHTSGPEYFAQWYEDMPGVNVPFTVDITLGPLVNGGLGFESYEFFPIDNVGFGNEGNIHNYHFTTEIHTEFVYSGGESFTFRGDDDLWLFINGKLGIDLGGLHQALSATVDLDAEAGRLGLTPGERYRMDIFHAERHRGESNFRIETNIECLVSII